MRTFLFFIIFLTLQTVNAFDKNLVETDIRSLFAQAGETSENIGFKWAIAGHNTARMTCGKNILITVAAEEKEQISTLYYLLRRLGFLFPHPRMQILPAAKTLLQNCGKSFTWKPLLKDRGFHLHTQHAGEWTDGFFMDQPQIAKDTLWWLARNQQNLVQLQTLRIDDQKLVANLTPLIDLAHGLGIKFGVSFSFAMIQQKNYYLVPLWRALTGIGDEETLRNKINEMARLLKFDYVTSEVGTTEFSSTDEEKTLRWMQIVQQELEKNHRDYFVKSHVSSNQRSEKYGNFNFLPQFAGAGVGVQAHTVFFYGLGDDNTPMYGRKNFHDMADFILAQKSKRPLWYFPETSYYIAMDIDVPLFLTDFLIARADDMRFLKEHGITGQVNFSTGQELGYWLFDWNLALLADSDLQQDPFAGLKLLGEDEKVWRPITDWQTKFIKKQQLIQPLSSANLMDDLYPLLPKTHERRLLRELKNNPEDLATEISKLEQALKERPSFDGVKNPELKAMLQILYLRTEHALKLRESLRDGSGEKLEQAARFRERALEEMQFIKRNYNRYPESFVFSEKENVTSYPYGYGWPAVSLHYWKREEEIIRHHQFWNPFYMCSYNPFRILL